MMFFYSMGNSVCGAVNRVVTSEQFQNGVATFSRVVTALADDVRNAPQWIPASLSNVATINDVGLFALRLLPLALLAYAGIKLARAICNLVIESRTGISVALLGIGAFAVYMCAAGR